MESMAEGRRIAVVLAAGTGSRMKAGVAKQFLMLGGKPLIYYALHVMEESPVIDECILVTGEADMEKMRRDVVEKYGFRKVTAIIPGGSERCYSVANAMRWISAISKEDAGSEKDVVLIHDGARPFVTERILETACQAAKIFGACVVAVPSKDTVKIADEEGFAAQTPERQKVWCVQTPQAFERNLITMAYGRFEEEWGKGRSLRGGRVPVTDDASVVERYTDVKVKLAEGDYANLKVTTPEDLILAEVLLEKNSF